MFERGKAEYFHGRETEQVFFRNALEKAKNKSLGTSFLIQGSPGVGKTALLEKCKEIALEKKWGVVQIKPDGLWDAEQLKKYLKKEWKIKLEGINAKAAVHGIGVEASFSFTEKSVLQVLNSSKNPLLLVLDEAQHLKSITKADFLFQDSVRKVLDELHNGGFKKPLLFAIGGLGHTINIFEQLGVSRFDGDFVFDLEALDKISERNIIRDFIYKEGGLSPTIGCDLWINKISKQTHGWPQHISAYGYSVSNYLKYKAKNMEGKQLTEDGLDDVLKDGSRKRFKYYEKRVASFTKQEIKSFVEVLDKNKPLLPMNYEDIINSFQKKYTLKKSEKLFENANEKGVFHRIPDGSYIIPIPSMHHWFVSGDWQVKAENLKRKEKEDLESVRYIPAFINSEKTSKKK